MDTKKSVKLNCFPLSEVFGITLLYEIKSSPRHEREHLTFILSQPFSRQTFR